ncbi:MAG TPA: NAD(P)H-binding protein [Mucilaginibacter sp.]|nr:NAD(P)H-binding protein [Mucilaginibacter sp.]
MKIIITGSLGHISKPLTEELVKKRHQVTVISSKPEKQKDIEALGAAAAIGSVEDISFLTTTFTGADAVYCMVPPNNYFDHNLDLMASYRQVAGNYAHAIRAAGVKRVVYLSSVGAHLSEGSGLILGHHAGEAIMNTLSDVAITFMRPVGFYYNLYSFVPVIKKDGIIAANYGADDMLVWVSPIDIAAAVAEELETPLTGKKIRYVVSDELTGHDTACILGTAIGKPDLKWILISNEEMLNGLKATGMNPGIAALMVEMLDSQHRGVLTENYYRNRPSEFGKVKLTDFAKEFANAFK